MSRNKLPPVMGESLRCNDEDAYQYVATRTPFNGSIFRAQWRSNDHTPDERYVVSARSVNGENAWIGNALTSDLMMEGETIYPLAPKDMLVMVNYGIGGVAAAVAGTGIEKGEQTGIYALDNEEGEKK